MSTQYTPSDITRLKITPLLIGLGGTAFLFALLPILQVIPNPFKSVPDIYTGDTAYDNPPVFSNCPEQNH